MNEPLYRLARNYANWPYKENEKALGDTFRFLFTDPRNGQVPMIGVVGGSGSGKSFFTDTNAKYLNERDFAKFGNEVDDEKRNTHYIAINISFNGNTNSGIVAKLMGKSDVEKEKILDREAALRIIFSFFQKRSDWNQVQSKWDPFYEKMSGIDLKIEDALKILIDDAFIQDPSIKDKDTIVVIGIDEISKLNKEADIDTMRSLVCRATDKFYKKYINDKGTKLDKLQVRMIFTSFLPTQTSSFTKSDRPIYYATLKSLSQKTVEELMVKWYNRAAFRAAINCCVGHQRSLEVLYMVLKEGEEKGKDWFLNAGNHQIFATDEVEFNIFRDVIQNLCVKLEDYAKNASWELLEPSLTGREIIPIYITPKGKEKIISYEFPAFYDYTNQKLAKIKSFSYADLFSDGLFVNSLPEESIGEKIIPQTTLFWLFLWWKKHAVVLKNDPPSQNQMEEKIVFVENNEKDLRLKYLKSLLGPIGWNPLKYEIYSSRLFAFKLELARCRTNEISLYDFFNGSLRWNPESIDAREIIIQFSKSPISLSSCNNHFSTLIKHDPSALKIGKAIAFNGNNPGFDHCFPLHCKIGNSKKTILFAAQEKYEGILTDSTPEHLSVVNKSLSLTLKELNKSYFEKDSKIPDETKKEFEEMEKILIFNSFHRTEFDEQKNEKLFDGKKKGEYVLIEEKGENGGLILKKHTKEIGKDGKEKHIIDQIDSLELLEDKYLPKGVYIIKNNVKAFGPTLSINNMGKFLHGSNNQNK